MCLIYFIASIPLAIMDMNTYTSFPFTVWNYFINEIIYRFPYIVRLLKVIKTYLTRQTTKFQCCFVYLSTCSQFLLIAINTPTWVPRATGWQRETGPNWGPSTPELDQVGRRVRKSLPESTSLRHSLRPDYHHRGQHEGSGICPLIIPHETSHFVKIIYNGKICAFSCSFCIVISHTHTNTPTL